MAPPLAPRLLPIKSANQRETHLFLMHVMFTVIVTKQNDVSICAYSPSLHIDQSVDGLPYPQISQVKQQRVAFSSHLFVVHYSTVCNLSTTIADTTL